MRTELSNKTITRLNKVLANLRRAERLLGGISVADTMPVLEAAMPIYSSVTVAIGQLAAIRATPALATAGPADATETAL